MIFAIILAFALLQLVPAQAPSTNVAVCNGTSFSWAFNSLGQDPCKIATALGSPCTTNGLIIPPLSDPTESYGGPSADNKTDCSCSSVYYSVLMVCAVCQGAGQVTWTNYDKNCNPAYLTVYKPAIPPGVAVPGWAYDDVSVANEVNLTLAQSQTTLPERSATAQPTISPSSTSETHSHKSDAGAIAGGVIGGLVVLAAAAAATFFCFIKPRRRGPRDLDLNPDESVAAMTYSPDPVTVQSSSLDYGPQSQKLYNPSDPSTFPPSPFSASTYATDTQHSRNRSLVNDLNEPRQGTQYTGAPEI